MSLREKKNFEEERRKRKKPEREREREVNKKIIFFF